MSKYVRLNMRGDTIVEVMICLAIISFIISISYATATRALKQSRQSQERVEAAKILESQIELLRANKGSLGSWANGERCFDSSKQLVQPNTDGSNCKFNGLYNTTIVQDGNNLYKISVTWDNATGTGKDIAAMYYRMYQ